MNRRALALLSLLAIACALSCEPPSKPASTSTATPTAATPTAASPQAAQAPGAAQAPWAPAPTPQGDATCQPLTEAKPMHAELGCLAQSIPHDRLVVINSRASLKGFVSEAERQTGTSCPMPMINFNTHHLVAYHARGPCQIRVEDKLCAGPTPRYKVDIFSPGGCSYYGTSPRFWLIPALEDGARMEVELTRKAQAQAKEG